MLYLFRKLHYRAQVVLVYGLGLCSRVLFDSIVRVSAESSDTLPLVLYFVGYGPPCTCGIAADGVAECVEAAIGSTYRGVEKSPELCDHC